MANLFHQENGRRYDLNEGVNDIGVVHARIFNLDDPSKTSSQINVYLFDKLQVGWPRSRKEGSPSEFVLAPFSVPLPARLEASLSGRGREWTGGYRTAELLEYLPQLYDQILLSNGEIFYSENRFSERNDPHDVWRVVRNIPRGAFKPTQDQPDYETTFFHFLSTQLPVLTRDLGAMLMLSGVPQEDIQKIQREIIDKLNRFHHDFIITPTRPDLERLVGSAIAP